MARALRTAYVYVVCGGRAGRAGRRARGVRFACRVRGARARGVSVSRMRADALVLLQRRPRVSMAVRVLRCSRSDHTLDFGI